MAPETTPVRRRTSGSLLLPSHVYHPSFDGADARATYDPAAVLDRPADYADRYMPDDVTRDHAKRMHHAAHRMHAVKSVPAARRWQQTYFALRDQIVLGNRKLIYRAVRRRMATSNRTDDLIGDCQIVLIQAVAAYNPWLGIRFSTYAYTCLIRALSRLSQRFTTDWLARAVSLEALPDGEPGGPFHPAARAGGQIPVDVFLRDEHPLLTDREKSIIARRFCLGDQSGEQTLEKVGKAMGLSKERVRQVQASALVKLRSALTAPGPVVG